MIIVGIDYSLTSPALCLFDTAAGDFCFSNTKCYFLASKKMHECYDDGVISAENYPKCWTTDEARFSSIAYWAEQIIYRSLGSRLVDELSVWIEGYSYGSSGKVFHIAENTGILKHRLYMGGIGYESVPPTSVKKFATGKGNSNKDMMYAAFCEETPETDLMSDLSPKAKAVNSPVSDIVDAFYICKFGFDTLTPKE